MKPELGNASADPRATVSVEEAGKILGIGRALAYRLAKDRQLPTIKLGNRLLVPKHALQKLLGQV